jgi:hypothetical protein
MEHTLEYFVIGFLAAIVISPFVDHFVKWMIQ